MKYTKAFVYSPKLFKTTEMNKMILNKDLENI